MRELRIRVPDAVAAELERRAARFELGPEAFLEERIPLALDDLVQRSRSHWLPRAEWQALVDGTRCPICDDLTRAESHRRGSLVVAREPDALLTLAENQSSPGYCVVWSTRHVSELFQLDPEPRRRFLDLWLRSARAVWEVYRPDKINYQVLGNLVPHLHAHVLPRYHGDRAPAGLLLPDAEPQTLTEDEYRSAVDALRAALEAQSAAL